MPTDGPAGDLNSFTPAVINALPDTIHDILTGAYNEALTPVFAMLIPMVLAGLVLVLFVEEVPLRASLDEAGEQSSLDMGVNATRPSPTVSSTSKPTTEEMQEIVLG